MNKIAFEYALASIVSQKLYPTTDENQSRVEEVLAQCGWNVTEYHKITAMKRFSSKYKHILAGQHYFEGRVRSIDSSALRPNEK